MLSLVSATEMDVWVEARVAGLRATADGIRARRGPAPAGEHRLVARARTWVGRRLISLGSAVAGGPA